MAQIDTFLEKLVLRGAERAELKSDQAGCVYKDGAQAAGPAVSLAQLKNLIQEICPLPHECRMAGDGSFFFEYQSPHGEFEIGVQPNGGALTVSLEPIRYVRSRAVPAPPQEFSVPFVPFAQAAKKRCPHCGEQIRAEAKKCRFCLKWLASMDLLGAPISSDTSDAASPKNTVGTRLDSPNQPTKIKSAKEVVKDRIKLAGAIALVIFAGYALHGALDDVASWSGTTTNSAPSSPQEALTQSLAGERFPQTRLRRLTEDELRGLRQEEVQYAINEMYARHGFKFGKNKARQFQQFVWYKPVEGRTQERVQQQFNSFEKSNYQLLVHRRNGSQAVQNETSRPSLDTNASMPQEAPNLNAHSAGAQSISLGTTSDEVLEMRGKPQDIIPLGSDGSDGYIVNWRYSDATYTFARREADGIEAYRVIRIR